MKKLVILGLVSALAVASQAVLIDSFVNADFELTTQNAFANGFDDNGGYDTPGWQDLTVITDSGVENSNAWWGTYDGYSAFMAVDNGAYNLSGYTIQAGDEFTIGFVGKTWDGNSEWTATLFYDSPTNVIGSYVTAVDGTWTAYSNPTAIEATAGSIGGTLGISFLNTGSGFANLDNVSVNVVPEPATIGLLGIFGAGMFVARRRFKR